jgi:hypothetical protein
MAVCFGGDLQLRTQIVCWMDTADGEVHERSLCSIFGLARTTQEFSRPANYEITIESQWPASN